MPFMKSAEGKIAMALDPEVAALKKAGFKLLNEAEDAAHRAELHLKPELTSAAAQDAARAEAGVQKALSTATKDAQAVEQKVDTAVKAAGKKSA